MRGPTSYDRRRIAFMGHRWDILIPMKNEPNWNELGINMTSYFLGTIANLYRLGHRCDVLQWQGHVVPDRNPFDNFSLQYHRSLLPHPRCVAQCGSCIPYSIWRLNEAANGSESSLSPPPNGSSSSSTTMVQLRTNNNNNNNPDPSPSFDSVLYWHM